MNPMRILMFPLGSSGDVHPHIGLGRTLKARGHEVIVFNNDYFAKVIERSDLQFVSTGTVAEYEEVQKNPDLWHPQRSFRAVMGNPMMQRAIRDQYRHIQEWHRPGETAVIAGSLALGARIARDSIAFPLVSLHLQPGVILSVERPPALPRGTIPSWWPRWLVRWLFRTAEKRLLDPVVVPSVNEFRQELALPPVRRVVSEWWHSPDLVLGLFPEWYASPVSDWPKQIALTGFPLYDEGNVKPLSTAVQQFLEAGDPPIVVTFGSAMRFAKPYFQAAAEAISRMGRRGLLLTPYREQLPAPLPPGIAHFDYEPLGQLLPYTAALIHHGGIGTSAQALAAGVPQLIMPLSHDQPDNAARLIALGVARSLRPARFRVRYLLPILKELTSSPAIQQSCQEVAKRFQQDDSLTRSAELIEKLVNQRAAPFVK
jgi:rhamnosyltransferase subunit B